MTDLGPMFGRCCMWKVLRQNCMIKAGSQAFVVGHLLVLRDSESTPQVERVETVTVAGRPIVLSASLSFSWTWSARDSAVSAGACSSSPSYIGNINRSPWSRSGNRR